MAAHCHIGDERDQPANQQAGSKISHQHTSQYSIQQRHRTDHETTGNFLRLVAQLMRVID